MHTPETFASGTAVIITPEYVDWFEKTIVPYSRIRAGQRGIIRSNTYIRGVLHYYISVTNADDLCAPATIVKNMIVKN